MAAHHSFAGTYVEGQLMKIEGKVVEFNIRNPHSFITIEVTDKDGKEYGIPTDKIAYVEFASEKAARTVGFSN